MRKKTLLAIGSTLVAMLSPSVANAEPSPIHTVKYIVYSDVPTTADIYYRDSDPPTFADYSHDPYRYSPKVEADLTPRGPWELEAALADPDQWAMVVVSAVLSAGKPGFRCELVVDGVVAAVNEGPKGALCSVRRW
jgi:hypothetical protein